MLLNVLFLIPIYKKNYFINYSIKKQLHINVILYVQNFEILYIHSHKHICIYMQSLY